MRLLLPLLMLCCIELANVQSYGGDFYAGLEPGVAFQSNSSNGNETSLLGFGLFAGAEYFLDNRASVGAGIRGEHNSYSSDFTNESTWMYCVEISGSYYPHGDDEEDWCFEPFAQTRGWMAWGNREVTYNDNFQSEQKDDLTERGIGIGIGGRISLCEGYHLLVNAPIFALESITRTPEDGNVNDATTINETRFGFNDQYVSVSFFMKI